MVSKLSRIYCTFNVLNRFSGKAFGKMSIDFVGELEHAYNILAIFPSGSQ